MADGGKLIIKIDGDDSDFKKVSGALGKVGDVGFKAIKAGAIAASGAIAAIGTAAITSYADYEQLVGGVETLFKDSAGIVQEYAANAYQSAGMSANEYMDTVTGFSASLLQSLGGDTAKAAEYANMAVTDMSDNANKMGTSMESLQFAYQGFAKQNYTMLDNLKLGYGGTKEEMARLIKDASKLDKSIKANDMSFGNIVKSINAVQKEMGILGTTAKEADSTITGSLNSMKAAWQNLMTGVADPSQDFDKLVQEFVDSVVTFGKNLAPRIKVVLNGAVELFRELGPAIVNAVRELLPSALGAFGEVLSGILGFVQKNIGPIITTIYALTTAFMTLKAVAAISAVISGVSTAISALGATATITSKVMTGLNAVMAANPFGAVAAAIALVVGGFVLLKSTLDENKTKSEELIAASEANIERLQEEARAYEELTEAKRSQAEADLAQLSYIESLAGELSTLADESGRVKDSDAARVDFILNELNSALGTEYDLVGNVISGYDELTNSVFKAIEAQKAEVILAAEKEVWAEAVKKQADGIKAQKEAALNLAEAEAHLASVEKTAEEQSKMTREEMRNYSLSVDDARKAVEKAAQEHETASGIVEQATNDMKQYESDYALVAQGKSKEVIDSYLGMGQSVTDYSNIVATEQQKAGQRYVDAVLALANYRASHKGELTTLEQETLAQLQQEAENAKEEADAVGVNIVDGTVEGINGKKYNLKSTITQLFNSVPDWAKTLLGIRSPSRVMRDEVGKMITAGVAVGIEEGKTEVQKAMQDMNEVLLDSEVRYLKESERIEKEKAEQELADRIKNAKDQEAVAKIYANEAKKRQEEENRAYLKGLKETADRERKIFEARQKDIENAQKAIRETFTELADAAFDSIDELEKAQTTLEDKLKGFGQLYSSSTVTFDGEEVEIVSLADMERQTQTLEGYAQALLDVKNRGSVPQEFFGVLRDLSIEDGMKFANALLMADDETFRKYINDWQKKQEASEAISRLLYADEAKEVKDEIEQSFSDFDANLETKGKENAEAWGEGFLQEVRRQIPTVLAEINSALASVVNAPQASIATGGGIPIANSTTYNTTYQLASSGETVRQQLQAIDAQETRNKLRGK